MSLRPIGEKFIVPYYSYYALSGGIIVNEVTEAEWVVVDHIHDPITNKSFVSIQATGVENVRKLTELELACMEKYMKAARMNILDDILFDQLMAKSVKENRVIPVSEFLDLD